MEIIIRTDNVAELKALVEAGVLKEKVKERKQYTLDDIYHYSIWKGGQTWIFDEMLKEGYTPYEILQIPDDTDTHPERNFGYYVMRNYEGCEQHIRDWFREHGVPLQEPESESDWENEDEEEDSQTEPEEESLRELLKRKLCKEDSDEE